MKHLWLNGFILLSWIGLMTCGIANLCAQTAQSGDWCGTSAVLDFQLRQQPDLIDKALQRRELRATGVRKTAENATHRFPVVVHIIHNGGRENITNAQVISMIDVLNKGFRHLPLRNNFTSSDDYGNGVDAGFEFYLARRDPDGNCTNGINRVQSPLADHKPFDDEGEFDYTLDSTLKNLSRWDTKQYINIWVIKTMGNTGGYAYLPWESTITDFLDGIVIRHDAAGNTGTSMFFKTLTHEMGHYFGLMHPFDNGHHRSAPETDSCGGDTPEDCATKGDYVCDTPPSTRAYFDCAVRNTCTETPFDRPDNIANYMAYNADDCRNMFTPDQKELMLSYLEEYRLPMATEANLLATGFRDSLLVDPVSVVAICADVDGVRQPITLKARGGTDYQWSPATGLNRTDGPEVVLTLNQSGFFTYTVTAMGVACGSSSQTAEVNVVCPMPLSFLVSSEEGADGLAEINVSAGGGLSPYKYSVSPRMPNDPNIWQDSSSFAGRWSGSYEVSILDAAGCMQTKTLGVTVSRKSSSGQIAGFGIYPNPSAQDKLYLAFSSERPIDAQWRVLSLDGREVATGKFQSTAGTNRQELKLDNLPAGVWFVELQLENGRLQVLPWVKL